MARSSIGERPGWKVWRGGFDSPTGYNKQDLKN